MRAFILAVSLGLGLPALADPLPAPLAGADLPAFALPFQRLLAGNDPAAVDDLHAAAEAGNLAALVALPEVLAWLPPAFAERQRLRSIGGVALDKAVAGAFPPAADWEAGRPAGRSEDILARSLRLFAAGEVEKASHALAIWLNQSGGQDADLAELSALPLPEVVLSTLIQSRMGDPTVTHTAGIDLTVSQLIKADRPGAWMALAAYGALHKGAGGKPPAGAEARIARILMAAGVSQADAAPRLAAAARALQLLHRIEAAQDPAAGAEAAAFLAGRPDLVAAETACRIACPDTATACTGAFLVGHGLWPARGDDVAAPFAALIPATGFYATPRGIDLALSAPLRRQREGYAQGPWWTAATTADACFAATAQRALP